MKPLWRRLMAMRAVTRAPTRRTAWSDRSPEPIPSWVIVTGCLVGLIYVVLVGHRPIFYIPGADYDDQLFASFAMRLASGHWLGAYTTTTLIKGIGFPIFLAINYCIGLPANTGLCLAYIVSVGYICIVIRPLVRSDVAALALFTILLFIPPLSSATTTRLDRDFFYTAESLALVASVINLFWRVAPRSNVVAGLLVGILGGWFYIIREESIWLLPTLAILLLSGWLGRSAPVRTGRIGLTIAAIMAIGIVGSVGLLNRLAYGSFVINETTSSAFQGALTALEKAAYPDWTPYIPVPAATRAKIYAQSPSFRRLKPFLDPENGVSPWVQSGCEEIPSTCGDLAGGWFLWAFRDAVANAGAANRPKQAAAYFKQLTLEVSNACQDGRLTCARWMVPMVPPFTREQVFSFPDHLWASLRLAAMIEPVFDAWPAISSLSGLDLQQVELTSVPQHGPGQVITLQGRISGAATSSLALVGLDATQIVQFVVHPDPASVPASSLAPQPTGGFEATISCIVAPCGVGFADAKGLKAEMPDLLAFDSLGQPIPLGDSTIVIDKRETSPLTLRTRAANFWVSHLPVLQRLYQGILGAGLVCYLAGGVFAIFARALPPLTAIASALGVGACAMAFILALIDATSFPALTYDYMAPALPLSVAAAVLSLIQAGLIVFGDRRYSSSL